MSLSIYKPNSKNSGCGFSFQCGIDQKSNNVSLYVKAIQQHSWDSVKKKGLFQKNAGDPEKNITVKFNEFEIGEFISSLQKRREYVTFHSFGDDSTVIKLVPWDKPLKDSKQTSPCFGLSFTKNGSQSFKTSLEAGEIECLIEFFKFCLQKSYDLKFKDQLKKLQSSSNNQQSQNQAPF